MDILELSNYTKNGLIGIVEKLGLKDSQKVIAEIENTNLTKHLKINDLEKYREYEKDKYLNQYYEKKYISRYGFLDIDDYRNVKNMVQIDPKIEESIISGYFKDSTIKKIYHYTSFDGFYKIVSTGRIRLSCISSLNDRSEMINSEEFIRKKVVSPYHHKRIEAFNSRFVISCSLLSDNLNQWRLYGDDGKGICIEFGIQEEINDEKFLIGKIVYGKVLLTELQKLVEKIYETFGAILVFRRLNLWNSFIKEIDYLDEKEIRLLYYANSNENNDCRWMVNGYGVLAKYIFFQLSNFPLKINKIILGPKIVEPELNQGQLKLFMKESNIKNYKEVHLSRINHYR